MPSEFVSHHQQHGVSLITIDRQAKLNALNADIIAALTEAVTAAGNNEETRVVVIQGAGDKAFVAGADIGELQNLDGRTAEALARRGHELMNLIQHLGKPVIASIGGYALGGGCELALACTLRIASENAMLGLPEVKLGLIPGYGGTQRLSRLVGSGRALELMLTGQLVDAATALGMGLVNQVVAPEELESATEKLAAKLARSAPLAMAGILNAVNQGSDLPLAEGLDVEIEAFAGLCTSEDMREGTTAFLEKRKATFTGR